jgi:hypothetical protein
MSKREPGEDSTLGTPDRPERHPYKKEVSHKGELDAIKELKATAESGTNSYSSYNKKMIKALKKD